MLQVQDEETRQRIGMDMKKRENERLDRHIQRSFHLRLHSFTFPSPFALKTLHSSESREFETSSPSQSAVIAKKRTFTADTFGPCSSLTFWLSALSFPFPLGLCGSVTVREMHSTDLSCISSVLEPKTLIYYLPITD